MSDTLTTTTLEEKVEAHFATQASRSRVADALDAKYKDEMDRQVKRVRDATHAGTVELPAFKDVEAAGEIKQEYPE